MPVWDSKSHCGKGSFLKKKIKPKPKLFYLISFTFFLVIFMMHFIIMYIIGAKKNKVMFSVWHGMDNAYFPYNLSFPCACWKLFFIVRKSKACLHWNTGKAKVKCWCVSHSGFFFLLLLWSDKWFLVPHGLEGTKLQITTTSDNKVFLHHLQSKHQEHSPLDLSSFMFNCKSWLNSLQVSGLEYIHWEPKHSTSWVPHLPVVVASLFWNCWQYN